MPLRTLLPLVALALAAGCTTESEPIDVPEALASIALTTKADTVAMEVYEALGGPEAWAALPYLRFNFGFERDGQAQVRNRHLWNRQTGDYRIEWTQGADSSYVVLFNVDSQEGQAYLNGEALDDAANTDLVQRAYRSFINDTYWLMAPVKLFDDGVNRTYMADSSDADTDVLHLTFGNVGLTPGDQYWLYVDRATGILDGWAFVLEGSDDDTPRRFTWMEYETFETDAGPVTFATRKEGAGGAFALLTDGVAVPAEVDADLFTDPAPRLN